MIRWAHGGRLADEKKSWLDEKVDAAKERAAAEAGKAVVSGIAAAAGQQLDSWLGAMEGELARRQGGATAPATPDGADPAEAPAPPKPPGPTAEERQSAAAAELVRMKAQARRAPQVDLVDDPVPAAAEPEVEAEVEELEELSAESVEEEGEEPGPPEAASYVPHVEPWVRPDPMAAAQAALEKARQVRRGAGLPEPEEPIRATVANPKDPFAAAAAALERAQAARASVGRSATQVEREERARKELELLKGGRGGANPADRGPADPGSTPHDEPAPKPAGPRRKL